MTIDGLLDIQINTTFLTNCDSRLVAKYNLYDSHPCFGAGLQTNNCVTLYFGLKKRYVKLIIQSIIHSGV